MKRFVCCIFFSGLVLAGCSRKGDGDVPNSGSQVETGTNQGIAVESAKNSQTPATPTENKSPGSNAVPTTALVMSELDQSLHEVAQESSKLDTDGLKSYAQAYKQAIIGKQNELEGLKAKLRGLSMAEIVGDKGRELKSEVEQCSAQITELKKRYNIYLGKLRQAGVDLAD